MEDVDIDPFGEHDKIEEPTDENIPLDPVTSGRGGVQTWEPECEQETSFGGRKLYNYTSQRIPGWKNIQTNRL